MLTKQTATILRWYSAKAVWGQRIRCTSILKVLWTK